MMETGYSQSTELPKKVPTHFRLKSVKVWQIEKIPPDAELVLGQNLFAQAYSPSQMNLARLLDGKIKISENGKTLKVDRKGKGNSWKTVSKNKVTMVTIEHGGAKHGIILYRHLGVLKACSANWVEGSSRDCSIVLLDGNLDGDYLDPSSDYISWQNSPFIKISKDHCLPKVGGVVKFNIEGQGSSARLVTKLESHAEGLNPTESEVIDAVNSFRLAVGLDTVVVDPEISSGCRKHVEYLHHHDPTKIGSVAGGGLGDFIREDESLEKYSAEGNRASINGMVGYLDNNQPASSIIDSSYRGTHLRRKMEIPGRMKFGAAELHSWVLASSGYASEVSEPGFTLIPAPGQVNVPSTCAGGWPSPKSHPQIYLQPRGFPISFSVYGKSENGNSPWLPNLFSSSTITLSTLGDNVLVPGFSFTNSDVFASSPTTSWYFVPAKPLEDGIEYVVRINAIPLEWDMLPKDSQKSTSGSIQFSYSFKTKDIANK